MCAIKVFSIVLILNDLPCLACVVSNLPCSARWKSRRFLPTPVPMMRMRSRKGVTMIELLTVLVIVGIVFVLGLPRLDSLVEVNAVRAAKRQFQSYIVVARAAAIRRSTAAAFKVAGSTMWVTSTSSTGTVSTIRDSIALASTQKVSVTVSGGATTDSLVFNSRGLESSPNASRTYIFSRGSSKDSICVTRLGMIAKCGL